MAGCRRFGNIVGGAIMRLIVAVLMEQNDEWQTQNRTMQIEGMAEMTVSLVESPTLQITPKAA